MTVEQLWQRRWWHRTIAVIGFVLFVGALSASATVPIGVEGGSCGSLIDPTPPRIAPDVSEDVPAVFAPMFARWRAGDADRVNDACQQRRLLVTTWVAGGTTLGVGLVLLARERREGRTTSTKLVIRPHPFVQAAMVAGAAVFVASAGIALVRGVHPGAADLLVISVGAATMVVGLRERVEVEDDQVTVIRTLTVDAIPQDSVVAVHRSGGRGRPAHLRLDPGIETNSRYLDLRHAPPRLARRVGVAPLPSTFTAGRLAAKLDLPCVPFAGRLPPLRTSGRPIPRL